MNKQQLIDRAASASGVERRETATIVETFLEKIADTIAKGEEVRLVGFGVFSVQHRKPSAGRNPRTGDRIQIGSVARPKFKAGVLLKTLMKTEGKKAQDRSIA